jgi:hypothetical protein
MALTLADKSNIRRHLGYPVAGLSRISQAGANLAQGAAGWRFFEAFGFLEYKMNNMNPDEECRLLGRAFAAAALVGPQPNPGDSVSLVLSGGPIGSPQTLTATVPNPPPAGDLAINLVNALGAAGASNTVLQAAGIFTFAPYGTGAYSQNSVPFPEVGFNCTQAFAMTGSGTGILVPQITASGVFLTPKTVQADGVTTIYGYLPILDSLEGDYAGTAQNIDTAQADVWKHTANEAGQRRSLYENWRQLLSDFIGVRLNDRARSRPQQTGAVSFA